MALISSSMQTLQKIASNSVDRAAECLSKQNIQTLSAKDQKLKLQSYRLEYLEQNAVSMSNGMSVASLQNHQNFIYNLDRSITRQEMIIQEWQTMAQQLTVIWQQCQRKKMSYDVLIERAGKKADVIALKKDQKSTDEFANARSAVLMMKQSVHHD